MNFYFIKQAKSNQQDGSDKHKLIEIHGHEQNTTEGSEFLDEALRMKEQPFLALRTEESIAPGCPDELL